MVQGVIAGGIRALKEAVEGAEDSEEMALQDFEDCDICDTDTIVGISASGNPRYVINFCRWQSLENAKPLLSHQIRRQE